MGNISYLFPTDDQSSNPSYHLGDATDCFRNGDGNGNDYCNIDHSPGISFESVMYIYDEDEDFVFVVKVKEDDPDDYIFVPNGSYESNTLL
mmetsp:Transcript_21252/g.30425  ORF Transcript_21252/g.30425 Transcript_21252/m.30425 type:complete len:91 (+) Transcript_21252:147-419(+)|eukprot:CAMPEP_0201706106 /NCGR_PEP_ID=MMETSP0578-20130828/47809_1 /ASSEMBLY_ACC=CAM_ASM_000663 /TAXON_ID=267565 /ORGANISM="Skeletonema grethea, Strain CCMP 1804" /LENGTH=90 /DNA_ID=CAMNT_0048194491 /DNA_START=123 /DNA_END=395 /DNA_ORIENTATION=+